MSADGQHHLHASIPLTALVDGGRDDTPDVVGLHVPAHIPRTSCCAACRGMTRPSAPVLRENTLHIHDATLRGHPLLGVEAVLIVGLLRIVHCHLALQRCN